MFVTPAYAQAAGGVEVHPVACGFDFQTGLYSDFDNGSGEIENVNISFE